MSGGRKLAAVSWTDRLRLVLAACAAIVAILCAVPAAGAAPSARTVTLTVCACKSAKSAVTLTGHTLAGTVYLFAAGLGRVSSVTVSVDGRRVSSARAGRHGLKPLALQTTRLSDGSHTLLVTFDRHGKPLASGSAGIAVANHVSAESLIATALALHGITFGRSLLYRTYALWHDDALPKAYRGTGSEADEAVLLEALQAKAKHELSAAEVRELAPALARPTAADGLFAPPPRRQKHRHAHAAAGSCTTPAGWKTEVGASIRVWSQSAADLAPTLKAAEEALSAEQPDMGSPQTDDGGSAAACAEGNPDARLDVYVMGTASEIRGRSYANGLVGNFGITAPTDTTGSTSSAYIMLNSASVNPVGNPERLKDVLVHEMYHALQDAHNWEVPVKWFREGSAEWAEIHYGPHNTVSQGDVGINLSNFQAQQPRSLTSLPTGLAAYDDFIWPLFMTEEGTNPAKAWDALGGASSEAGALQAIDSAFPFASHLSTFALRDLQIPYVEEGSNDKAPEFQTASQDGVPSLPTDKPESYENVEANTPITLNGTAEKDQSEPITLPGSLEVRYKTIELPPKEEVDKVTIDFNGLPGEITPEALVHLKDGNWESRKMDGDKLEFCRDEPDDEIETIVVALSNHSLEGQSPTQAEYTYKTAKECAAAGLSGTLDLSAESTGDPEAEVHINGNVNVNFKDNPDGDVEESTFSLASQFKGARVVENEGREEEEKYEGSYSALGGPPLVVLNLGTHVEIYVVLTDIGSTTTTGGPTEGEGACGGGPGTAEDAWDFLAGPYTIETPAGSGPHTIQINNTEPFAFQFHVGTGCYGLPAGLEPKWSGSLTWTPPPQQSQ
jgi:hypothetical protein